jgi:uncharacterized cofD-like protein
VTVRGGPRSGPRVVALGGGHGLAATLRAARSYAGEITAVVSVADDGGSTGRIRAADDRPAPGDLRKCLVALADDDSLLARSMEHRFAAGDIRGHAFGNLLIVALTETSGDLVAALDEIGRLIGAVGRVLPATSEPVGLRGSVSSGGTVEGQVAVSSCSGVVSVEVEPADVPACPDAVSAIELADQIVLGPGSLFTSVLAATGVGGIRDALLAAKGRLVYVCNLRPQHPETDGFGVADHVEALRRHGIEPDVVLFDPASIGPAEGVVDVVAAPLTRPPARAHDPALLGAALEHLVRP